MIDWIARLELMRYSRPLEHVSRQLNQWSARRLGGVLNLTGALDSPHSQECLRRRAAADQQAVIAQNQVALVAERAHEARLFVIAHCDPLEGVVGDMTMHQSGVEVIRGETVALAGDRHASSRVGVHDAMRVVARRVRESRRRPEDARLAEPRPDARFYVFFTHAAPRLTSRSQIVRILRFRARKFASP